MVAINTMIGRPWVDPDKRFAALCLGASNVQVFFSCHYPRGRSEHRDRA